MSSYFDEASLVMIPSGYKDQKVYSVKPLDGTGDLTFTRASSATRVQSNGLIEKVRTNNYLYSNTFTDAAWTNLRMNFTASAAANPLTGTNDAFKARPSTDSGIHAIRQTIVYGVLSIYAKKGENNKIGFRDDGDTGFYATFNLDTGVLIEKSASALASITALSGGWYRVQFAVPTSSSKLAGIYFLDNAYSSGSPVSNTYAGNGTDGLFIYASQAESGDIATDYIPTTTAAVSVGPVSGLPRLDYLNSTCPRLLLEPQRTNSVTYSEQFDNAAWQKTAAGTGVTPAITANYAISPSGYQDADLVVFNRGAGNTSSDFSWIYQNFVTSAATYTISCYVKAATSADIGKNLAWRNFGGGDAWDVTLTNQWQRISVQATGSGSSQEVGFYNRGGYSSANSVSVLMWGFQAEVGAYATSYIPTLGTSVTRVADGTGTSDVFGTTYTLDSDFGLYWEGVINGNNSYPFFYSGGNYAAGSDYRSYFTYTGTNLRLFGVGEALTGNVAVSLTAGTYYKILVKRVGSTIKWYVNGTEYANASGFTTTTVKMRSLFGSTLGGPNHESVAKALIFETTLSDAQGIELTTL